MWSSEPTQESVTSELCPGDLSAWVGNSAANQSLAAVELARENFPVNNKPLRVRASIGLAAGGALGLGGTFAPSASLRGLTWGIDGVALVMAAALPAGSFFRSGQDLVAAGFLVFAVGEDVIRSGAAILFTVTATQIFSGT